MVGFCQSGGVAGCEAADVAWARRRKRQRQRPILELLEEMEREWSEKYGNESVSIGENMSMLAMVMESEEMEFDVA